MVIGVLFVSPAHPHAMTAHLAFRVCTDVSVESVMISISLKAGMYLETGSSRSSPPFSTRCMIAMAVTTLEQEKMANT